MRVSLWGQNCIPPKELLKFSSICKACSAYSNVLLQTKVLNLVGTSVVLPVMGLLGLVGLEATDVMGCALHQSAHQVIGLSPDLATSSCWSAPCSSTGVIREQVLYELA